MTTLASSLYESNFLVLNSDTKIHIPYPDSFVYPAAVVVFERPEYYQGRNDIIVNPLLIVEVASRSARKYDRTTTF